jgi:ATP-dependent DNA helicase RecG
MPESQNIEYKSSWRDEYLKWICGFANAQGGKLYIGIDDNGEVCGVQNAKKLMEDIPNKIREALGILVDVNLLSVDSKEYLEISVSASSDPINYKGEYHYRSGSTKQLLQGPALTQFLLNRTRMV